jgi:hypothetical protein
VPVVGAIEAELKRSRHAPSKSCSSDILVIRTNKEKKKRFCNKKPRKKQTNLSLQYPKYVVHVPNCLAGGVFTGCL